MWRSLGEDAGWPRSDLLLVALERRTTLLWATVATALGHKPTDADLAGPLDTPATTSTATARGGDAEPETKSMREIALWMRGA